MRLMDIKGYGFILLECSLLSFSLFSVKLYSFFPCIHVKSTTLDLLSEFDSSSWHEANGKIGINNACVK